MHVAAEVFHQATKLAAVRARNLSAVTVCTSTAERSGQLDRVLDQALFPLIRSAVRIALPGYSPSWTASFSERPDRLPGWAQVLDDRVEKHGRVYYLNTSAASDARLRDFWIDASRVVSGRTVRPALPIIEVDVESVPVRQIAEVTRVLAFAERFLGGSGARVAARRWLGQSEQRQAAGRIFFVYQDPTILIGYGIGTALERYVDRIMIEANWRDNYWKYGMTQDEVASIRLFTPRQDETIAACAERIAQEMLA